MQKENPEGVVVELGVASEETQGGIMLGGEPDRHEFPLSLDD